MTTEQVVYELNRCRLWWVRSVTIKEKDDRRYIAVDFPWWALPLYWIGWIKYRICGHIRLVEQREEAED